MSVVGYSRAIHNALPFAGQGASLYVTAGATPQYRRLLLGGRRRVLRQGWSGRNAKTLRVASDAGVSDDQIDFAYDLSSLAAGDYVADVRHYLNGLENLTTNAGVVRFEIDGAAAEVSQILGTATWLRPDIRAGGIVRFRWVWHPAADGTQPDTFRIAFSGGPTSPSDLTTSVVAGQLDYELISLALSDASAYTVTLSAELSAVTATLASNSVTADATGPAAPSLVSINAQ